jgi:hypothetical protein
MKKIICDRCGNDGTKKIIQLGNEHKEIDLCDVCYDDFKIFMERKPLIDLRKIFK